MTSSRAAFTWKSKMRTSLFVVLFTSLCWSGIASAQVPTLNRGGGVAGTGLGVGAGAAGVQTTTPPTFNRGRSAIVVLGTGHIGAGTGGLGQGMGNAVGGINNTAIGVGTGGMGDVTSWGSNTGGIIGSGRAQDAGAGGIKDTAGNQYGLNTGGINGSNIGAGTGGISDLNSLGAQTGGTRENNAPRLSVSR